MPKFRQTAEILKLMGKKECIRNIGIIAHIDHGKTTMTDSLLAEAGLLPPQMAGKAKVLDYLEEEQKRGITIKTANISLLHKFSGNNYIINLVDTPGHVDFTGKVAWALRAIDGAVVVVDAVEEVMAQTETVTRQALEERVRPVLFINKVDRLIKELKMSPKEIERKFNNIIRDFNNIIEIYGEPNYKEKWKVNPEKETVAFGSALHRWGFTTATANKKGIKFSEILKAYEKGEIEMLSQLLPLSDAILEMVVKNVPNPVEAQKYRVPKIWRGEVESEIGQAMLNCDDDGPTVMCVTATQMDPKFGVVATGRIFSGSIKEGDAIYLAGANKEYCVQNVFMYMGAFKESVNEMFAGNIAALASLDFARAGETIVDLKHKDVVVPFERVKYVSEPVMTVVVEPKNPKDLHLLVEAMNRLCIEDPNLNAVIDKETGHYLLSGIGELHLEIALKSLTQHIGQIPLVVSNPLVAYRETILEKGETVTTKTSNRKNEFSLRVEPLEKDFVELIEKGDIACGIELKKLGEILHVRCGYSKEEAEKLCAFDLHGNILLNFAENISEIRDSVILGFKWACDHGPLCEEPLRGIKVKLLDAQISEVPQMREPTQIMRAVARAILGSALTAKPVLLEPVYKIEVSVPTQWFGACSNIIVRRRGRIRAAENRGALTMITGYIPVAETFGLASEMRSATSGRAFWQCTFSHWEETPENIAAEVITQIRSRRGLPLKIPRPEDFID